MSQYQKGKTNLDFTEARDSEWQWHQLGHMQVCTSFQTDNHASTPSLSFLQAGCPSCRPTNSIKDFSVICKHANTIFIEPGKSLRYNRKRSRPITEQRHSTDETVICGMQNLVSRIVTKRKMWHHSAVLCRILPIVNFPSAFYNSAFYPAHDSWREIADKCNGKDV